MTREEAIKIIRDTYHTDTELEALKVLVPELKESEDEKIRKEVIELISCMHDADPRKKGWLAWLEKQKEQKPGAKLTGWVARDSKYNSYFGLGLVLFKGKPRRSGECWSGAIAAQLPWELFPDLKWMGEPMEVEVTIRRK